MSTTALWTIFAYNISSSVSVLLFSTVIPKVSVLLKRSPVAVSRSHHLQTCNLVEFQDEFTQCSGYPWGPEDLYPHGLEMYALCVETIYEGQLGDGSSATWRTPRRLFDPGETNSLSLVQCLFWSEGFKIFLQRCEVRKSLWDRQKRLLVSSRCPAPSFL